VVFFDLPAIFDLRAMLSGGAGISWQPANGARIGVLDRRDPAATVRWFDVEPFWVFHFLNASDDGDSVVVEGCRAERLNIAFGPDELDSAAPPTLHRWRIDLAAGRVHDGPLDDRPADFPRLDDRRAGKPARFGYLAAARDWSDEVADFDGFVKHDLATGASERYSYGPRSFAGEAVFAPDPTRTDEDAGWLVNFVHDGDRDESSLVIVDAQALKEVARVRLPRRVPFGFHGSWLAAM
jgi:carotenoid cleavage dioxygenase